MRGILAKAMLAVALGVLLGSFAAAAPTVGTTKGLRIYFVDVEGGQSTLFVTPDGKSLLYYSGGINVAASQQHSSLR